ncbi:helix-turn-helix transcriptional regulator [uncultured Intestinimonas sp.]|uniref:helix-turn-helix domain-containing protein n=1 Tax=uncultured Intestinimonas sp. TaxID=1689265 RepID=UPI0025D413F8|nr:helix-turn-helix transcriptional regulator [uncultured Intestinimonas sp.]
MVVCNERLRQLRKEGQFTQSQVAEACGMALRAYQRLEADARPNYNSLLKLANFYQVSVDWLMGRTEDRVLHQL